MDIVLITTYNRPDYLRLCLEYLSRASGIADKEIWICVDRGRVLMREIYEVLMDFSKSLRIVTKFRPAHSYTGNTFNTLESYKEAYQTEADFVYLVEDDVLVQPDFFKWHEAVQAQADFFCSVAYRCIRNTGTFIGCTDPTAYFTTSRDFASIGVCWRRTGLASVVEHATEEYYQNLRGYLTGRFPNNRFSDCFAEQDGLIMRILGETHGNIAWPYVPRAYHFGVSGYNRPRGPRLSYDEIKEMIHSADRIRTAAVDFQDIEPMPEPTPSWDATKLHCVQRFD